MRGIKSFGMLLAASNDAHDVVEPLSPPAGAAPGTRIWFGQHQEQVSEGRGVCLKPSSVVGLD
jgi:tRNA-binding EMAP/Myf-like protein